MLENLITVSIKNKIQPFHWQDKLTLFFILRGEADLVLNDRKEHLKAGQISVVNVENVHCIENKSDDLLYVDATINIEEFEQYIPGISTIYFKCTTEETDIVSENLKEEIKNQIAQIVRLMAVIRKHKNAEQSIIYHCIEILNNLKMRFDYVGTKLNDTSANGKTNQFWQFVDYVYDNYSRRITMQEAADHIFVSKSYLGRLIKEQARASFEEFLSFVRAETSLKYLLNSELSITNIAYECGFSAPRYYYKAFERIYKCSPAEYRKRNKDFFMMEKMSSAAGIVYDEGIEKDEVMPLLKKYRMFEVAEDTGRETIKINLAEAIQQKGTLNMDNDIRFDELFDSYGEALPMYHIQTAFREIKRPYSFITPNCIIYKTNPTTTNIVIFNLSDDKNCYYDIDISGMEEGRDYLCCRKDPPVLSDDMRTLLSDGAKRMVIDPSMIRVIMQPPLKCDVYHFGMPFLINVELPGKGVSIIKIQKI